MERRGRGSGASAGVPFSSSPPPNSPPRGLSPRGLNGSRAPGPEADGGSEIWARGGTGKGRRGGAPRRGVAGAQGEGAGRRGCSARSRLWGLGFAARGALGRELEPGTELGSQRSHRDERRSRRLGFSRRPAPSVRPPDRWAAAGPRPLRCRCPGALQLAGLFRERRGSRGSRRPGVTAAREIRGDPGTPLRAASLTCARSRQSPVVGVLSRGLSPGKGGSERGRSGVREVRAGGAGCVLVWGCFGAVGARAPRRAGRGLAPW